MAVSTPTRKPEADRYTAPALEKGLDILELLADDPAGLNLKMICDRLKRSTSEIYRMLASLERRQYLRRESPAETYHLTGKLFELAHRHPPTSRLLDTALPLMRRIAEVCMQSCQLVTPYEGQVMVSAQVDSPQQIGLTVRVGAVMPLLQTTSGLVILAYEPDDAREAAINRLAGEDQRETLERRLETIRTRGFARVRSKTVSGVIDLSYPVIDHTGRAAAALTMPFLVARDRPRDTTTAETELASASKSLSRSLGAEAAS